jgi:hypothetical protein
MQGLLTHSGLPDGPLPCAYSAWRTLCHFDGLHVAGGISYAPRHDEETDEIPRSSG